VGGAREKEKSLAGEAARAASDQSGGVSRRTANTFFLKKYFFTNL